ncbi:MAG: hypothetical protein RLZ25_2269 [Pseudomonadota bacterium]
MENRSHEPGAEREILESMLGFAGFHPRGEPTGKEGLLKITQSQRPDGSGYMTLTFILDAEGRELRARQLPLLDEAGLRAALGPRFEMLMDLPLRGRAPESSHWIEEIDLFFRPLDPFPIPFVSEVLLPVLEQQLALEFEALSDWVSHPALLAATHPRSLLKRCLRWLRLA